MFTGSGEGRGDKDKHPPMKIHTWSLAHKQKLKHARGLLMSTFNGLVISKMGDRLVLVLVQDVISTPFTFNSDYLRVSTSSLFSAGVVI